MLTQNQLTKKHLLRQRKFHKRSRATRLDECPQKKGTCKKIRLAKPKKPNSAIRKVAKVRLSNGKNIVGYIAGFGHNLREYSNVLVRGGNIPDMPGVHYVLIRGKFDFTSSQDIDRLHRRSLYGIPRDLTKTF
jgi:small subunit ribosomal protein S12